MSPKPYKKHTEVYEELERYCALHPGGVLPGERELAILFGTSRMTLRKALETAELDMLIRRGRLRSEILLSAGRLERYGRVLFIGPGYHHVALGALSRLHAALKSRIEAAGGTMDVYLTSEYTSPEQIMAHCAGYQTVLLSIANSSGGAMSFSQLRDLQREHLVIALSDPYVDECANFAALDNRAVGRIAGKTLIGAGCRKMVFISGNSSSIMFDKRREGFLSALQDSDLHCTLEFPSLPRGHIAEIRRDQLREAVAAGCDGGFIASDEGIEFIIHGLWENRIIPDRFKLVTLHGSGEALSCHPPVCCLSHATDPVADAVIHYLKRYARNPNIAPLRALLAPELYIHPTIGEHFTQKEPMP